MRLRSHILFILLVTFPLSLGFAVGNPLEAAEFEIAVKPGVKAFTPQEIKIKAGDQVTWVNKDEEEHFLTSAGSLTREVVKGTEDLMIHTLLHPGARYTHNFTEPETYYYFCAIHMQMWGTVIVEK
jgi:plastocyanin